MNEDLKEWLKYRWKLDNHNKYQKYFDVWYDNLTSSQILGFTHYMYIDKHNILRC